MNAFSRRKLGCERLEDRRLLAILASANDPDSSGTELSDPPLETGSIGGLKWEDLNGNGQHDNREPGLAGVTIYSDLNFNGVLDPDEPHTLTRQSDPTTTPDQAGRYSLEGLRPGYHMVREIVPAGFEQTFPDPELPLGYQPPPWGDSSVHVVFVEQGATVQGIDFGNRRLRPGSIHGVKWEDASGNGQRDGDETGLPGVVIYSDLNLNGQFDSDEPHAVTMRDNPVTDFDEGGLYWLRLRPGWHTIREVVPAGFEQTYPWLVHPATDALSPIPFPGEGFHEVFVESQQSIDGIDFGNRRIEPGSVHGVKWEDYDADGVQDANEPGLGGVTIYSDLNYNGQLDDDEPRAVSMMEDPFTDFDEGGLYWLEGLRPGIHIIREVVPDGFRQTFPIGPVPLPLDPLTEDGVIAPPPSEGGHLVFLDSGQQIDAIDFGNHRVGRGVIHGRKWEDLNGNSRHDDHEPGLGGVTIYSDLNGNGVLDPDEPSAVTMSDNPFSDFDEAGLYLLHVESGRHMVREVVPDGFRQTFPLSIFAAPGLDAPLPLPGGGFHNVLVEPGQFVDGIHFGNQPIPQTGSIHGLKWLDRNGNAERDPDEPGLPGVTIYVDLNNNGVLDDREPRTKTIEDFTEVFPNNTGRYWLTDLPPGEHIIREVVPDGFAQTFPLPGPIVPFPEPGPIGPDGTPLDGSDPDVTDPNGEAPDQFATVSPEMIDVTVAAGDAFVTDVAITIHPFLFRPYEINVISSDADIPVLNLSGIQPNGGGGQTSTFEVMMFGDGLFHQFDLQFVDAEFGDVLAAIPVIIRPDGIGGGAHRVVLEPGDVVEGIDFGNRPITPPTGSIHGLKWLDRNGNAERDPDEPGLPGVTIYVDLNNNGVLDDREPRTKTIEDDATVVPNDTGRYWLTDLPPGEHIIREVVPEGFEQIFPRSGSLGPDGTPLDPSDPDVTDPNGEVNDPFATVSPEIIDLALAAGDAFVTDVAITIHPFLFRPYEIDVISSDADIPVLNLSGIQPNSGGGQTSTFEVMMFGDGLFHQFDLQFVDAEFGDVLAAIPVIIRPDGIGGGGHRVVLEPGDVVEGIDFGNRPITPPTGSIHGLKWLDRNGNAERDPDEPGLPGVTIYVDLNNNGVLDDREPRTRTMRDDPNTIRNERGRYWLTDLPPGEHIIREVVPDGFEQTFPLSGPIGPDGTPLDPRDPNVTDPNGEVNDPFATVSPEIIDLTLAVGDEFVTDVAITIHPFLFRPYEIDVISSDPDLPVLNQSGIQPNGGGGDTSTFEVVMFGDGLFHEFDLQFVDAEFGGVLAAIPVVVRPDGIGGGGHRVVLEPGDVVRGIDFGNRRIVLPGDFNRDGVVNDSDHEVWLRTFGSTTVLDADANDNGVVDAADAGIWRDNLSATVTSAIINDAPERLADPLQAARETVFRRLGKRHEAGLHDRLSGRTDDVSEETLSAVWGAWCGFLP